MERDSRYEDGALSIVSTGEATAEIVWWCADDSPVASFAANELQEYIREISGGEIPTTAAIAGTDTDTISSAVAIVPECSMGEIRDPTNQVATLPDRWLQSVDQTVRKSKPDSFAVQTQTDTTVLAGSTHRGTLYAVYDCIERLGVQFFAPDFEFYDGNNEHVPTRSSIAIPEQEYVEEPSLEYRRKDIAEGRSHTSRTICEMVDWMAKTRHNILAAPADYSDFEQETVTWDHWREDVVPELEKRGLMLEVGGHGFDSFLPPNEYEDTHPEWFVDGYNVFDLTNEQAVETYIENVIEYLENRPEIGIFDVWPPDNADWPPQITDTFGSTANAYAYVVNTLQDAIHSAFPDHDHEIAFEAIAYMSHIHPPDDEYMYDESTIIDFAPFDRSYASPISEMDSEMNEKYLNVFEEWDRAFDGTLGTYEYYRKYSWHSLPVVVPMLIGRELPFYESIGLNGLWLYSEPADWLTYELTHRLVAAMSWDTGLDVDAYLDTYLDERYGPAADEMRRYFELVENAGRKLFRSFGGAYDDEDIVTEIRTEYRSARDILNRAQLNVEEGSAAMGLLHRLEANIEFAIADTEISYHQLIDDETATTETKQRTRALIERHRFNGTVLKTNWSLERCSPDDRIPTPQQSIDEYRRQWG